MCLDRRRNTILDAPGVYAKFGVGPASIPDYLALVGDSADGIPGIPRWGSKTSARVLRHYGHLEQIPEDASEWNVDVRGAEGAAASLALHREDALFYRDLATLRLDVPIGETVAEVKWRGVPRQRFREFCADLGLIGLAEQPHRWDDR